MYYPATFKQDGDGYIVTFRDIPEAIAQGGSFEEALDMAKEALLTAISFYYESYKPIPSPSELLENEVAVEINANASIKILLYNEMIKKHIKKSKMARLLGMKPQQVTRLFDFSHNSNLDTINKAFKAIGSKLVVNIE